MFDCFVYVDEASTATRKSRNSVGEMIEMKKRQQNYDKIKENAWKLVKYLVSRTSNGVLSLPMIDLPIDPHQVLCNICKTRWLIKVGLFLF